MRDRVAMWVAWRLPRWLVYHALIRAWAHGTTGRYGNTEAPAVRMDEIVRRWNG